MSSNVGLTQQLQSRENKQADNQATPISISSVKTASIRDFAEVSKIDQSLSLREDVILIGKVSESLLSDKGTLEKFIDKVYSIAKRNNYSLFRLGEDRIIAIPDGVPVVTTAS